MLHTASLKISEIHMYQSIFISIWDHETGEAGGLGHGLNNPE